MKDKPFKWAEPYNYQQASKEADLSLAQWYLQLEIDKQAFPRYIEGADPYTTRYIVLSDPYTTTKLTNKKLLLL